MKVMQAAILAAVLAGAVLTAGAQTTTTVVNSSIPGDRTIDRTTVAPNGKTSTTATIITRTLDSRNTLTTHSSVNGVTSSRDTVVTHSALVGDQKLVVNGPKVSR